MLSKKGSEHQVKISLNDRSLFGNEAAEDEDEGIFESYAVTRPEITDFLDEKRPVAVVCAYKGEGKSALLRLVSLRLKEHDQDALVIRTSAPAISPDIDGDDVDKWTKGWKTAFVRLAVNELGSRISLAFSDDAMSLVEEAENNGFKQKSFASSLFDRIQSPLSPIGASGILRAL